MLAGCRFVIFAAILARYLDEYLGTHEQTVV